MKSFRILVLLAALLSAVLVPTSAAQQSGAIAHIGWAGAWPLLDEEVDAFLESLRERNWIEGKNIIIEWRVAESPERVDRVLAEFVKLDVDVIVTQTTPIALAAKKATTTIPVVFMWVSDPVASNIVASLSKPGGNMTGFSTMSPELSAKRVELMNDLIPSLKKVGLLINPASVILPILLEPTRRAAESFGLEVHVFGAQAPHEFEPAFEAMTDMGIEALVEVADAVLYRARKRIAELAARHRIPGIYEEGFAEVGGLMSYGLNFAIHVKPVGAFVDAILKGADPGQLPVQQPTVFELIINLGAAKELGLTIPRSLALQADVFIEQ